MCDVFFQFVKNQTSTVRKATRQHLTNQANQPGMCFVLNEYSDDRNASACMVGQNVLLLTEATEHITLTPTASAAVDIVNTATFQRSRDGRRRRNMWRPKPITGHDGTKRSRVERIVVCCTELFCAFVRNTLYRAPKQ